jgi:hypothetical protein
MVSTSDFLNNRDTALLASDFDFDFLNPAGASAGFSSVWLEMALFALSLFP